MDSGYGTSFDPTTLSTDDPLRDTSVQDWIDKVKTDHPELAGQLATDPQAAIKGLADKGVGPPPMSFADPYGNSIDPTTGMPQSGPAAPMPPGQQPDPTASQGPYVINKPAAPQVPPVATPQPSVAPPIAPPNNALDPEENPSPVAPGAVPTPTPKPDSTKKKDDDKGAGDFAKMIAALKPVPPPALNPVGTPSVRSPSATNAPNIAQLLSLFGQQSTPSPVNTLGRLLVAGKA